MNDAVDRVIVEREAMDRGLPGGLALSGLAHVLLLGAALAAPFLVSQPPPIEIAPGFAVQLPRGGGGSPEAEPPAPAPPAPEPAPPVTTPPKPEPSKVVKPPKEERRKGLPEPDAKRGKKPKPETSPAARPASGVPGGTGKGTQTLGIGIGPPGPGTPEGTDYSGDWYLASVQQKIWMIWTQEIKAGFTQPIAVTFTILADGQLADVRVTQTSGVALLDLAAQRAVYSAEPFSPLPKDYGTNRLTIQAIFKPTQ